MTRFRLNNLDRNMIEMPSHLPYSVLSGRHLSLLGKADSSFPEKLGMSPQLLQLQSPVSEGTERTKTQTDSTLLKACRVLARRRETGSRRLAP